jgi:signal transduction histidine kinase
VRPILYGLVFQLIFLLYWPGQASAAVQLIEQAWVLESSSTSPPVFTPSRWKKTALPDHWDMSRKDFGGQVWYYATFSLDQTVKTPWAIYLPRAVHTVEVYINGSVIGNSGHFTQPLSRNWVRPHLFNISPGLLKAGENTLAIRLAGYVHANSGLYAVSIGAENELKPIYQTRYHLQITASQMSALLMFCIGLLAIVLWNYRRTDPVYFWLGLSSFMGAILTSNWWVQEIPVDRVYWETFWYGSIGWYVYCIVNFVHRFIGFGSRRIENSFMVYLLISTPTLLLVDESLLVRVSNVILAGYMVHAAYILTLMYMARTRENARDVYVLLACLWVALLLAAHDWLGEAIEPPPINLFVFYLSPLMVLVVILWVLLSRHFRTLNAFENLTAELQSRVDEKSVQLEQSHQQILQLERIKAIDHERQRIMLDLHDGMGGYLVSALSITELELGNDNTLHQTLTLAMQDLRFMIDSMDADDADLITVLAMFRQRMEPILKSQGIGLTWQVEQEPRLINAGPSQSLQVMRIVQEAVTNIIKHAAATEVVITMKQQAIVIRDNGSGLQANDHSGHGLDNMQRRASSIDANVKLQSTAEGITLSLSWGDIH